MPSSPRGARLPARDRVLEKRRGDLLDVGVVADAIDGVRIGQRVAGRVIASEVAIDEVRRHFVLARQAQGLEDAVARLDQEKRGAVGHLVAQHREQRETPHRAIDRLGERLGKLDRHAIGAFAQKSAAHGERERKRAVQDGNADQASSHATSLALAALYDQRGKTY